MPVKPPPAARLTAALAGLAAAVALLPGPPAAAAAPAAPAPARAAGGSLVLVGGGLADDNAAVYDDIVRLAGGRGQARIGVITAAAVTPAEDPDAGTPDCNNSVCNGAYYADLFRRYGAAAEWIPIDADRPGAADDPAVVRQVQGMTGFFLGGGDQYRYVQLMQRGAGGDSAVLAAIRARLAAGAVVAGTSAGAQIQAGADMVTGGESYEGLRDGSRPGYFDDPTVLGYLPEGGFGFFRAGQLDTHFSARGRLGRAVRLAADTGHDRVFGLDEDTALEVTGVGTGTETMRVLGDAAVHVYDLRDARTGVRGGEWRVDGVGWTRVGAGDGYDAGMWRLLPNRPRLSPASGGCPRPPADDVFARDVLPELAAGLGERSGCRTVSGTTDQRDPRFAVTLTRGPSYRAYGEDTVVSSADVRVAIAAVRR